MEHGTQDIPLNMNGIEQDINSSKLLNGSYSPEEPVMNGDSSPKPEDATPTYADAFPPLSSAASGPASAKGPVWGKGGSAKVKQPSKPVNKFQSSDSSQVSKSYTMVVLFFKSLMCFFFYKCSLFS